MSILNLIDEHKESLLGVWKGVRQDLRRWLTDTVAMTLYIESASWEIAYCKSLNRSCATSSSMATFNQSKVIRGLDKRWRLLYNTTRPHPSLG